MIEIKAPSRVPFNIHISKGTPPFGIGDFRTLEIHHDAQYSTCLLYTSPSPRD